MSAFKIRAVQARWRAKKLSHEPEAVLGACGEVQMRTRARLDRKVEMTMGHNRRLRQLVSEGVWVCWWACMCGDDTRVVVAFDALGRLAGVQCGVQVGVFEL